MQRDSNQKGSDFKTLQSSDKPQEPEKTITPVTPNPSSSRGQRGRKPQVNRNGRSGSGKREHRFKTTGQLGQGGWGVVESAIDKQLQRTVAIKRIVESEKAGLSVKERFLHEARITSQLQHPGIVPVHELEDGSDGSDVYYVMKKLVGKPFRELIRETHSTLNNSNQKETLKEAILPLLDRFVHICEAVAYAHQQGILHRDLKPDNVMVGEFGETIVVDWGLAKRFAEPEDQAPSSVEERTDEQLAKVTQLTAEIEQTISGSVLGTPAYMSPEQAKGENEFLGPASDIYSLGVILYEILLGAHPHGGHGTEKVLERVKSGNFKRPVHARKGVPRALAAICENCMSLDPNQRYTSAVELAEDVRSFISGEAVSVYREGWIDRAARWCRRHRTFALTAAGALIVLLLASLVFGYFISQAHRAEQMAHQQSIDAHRQTLNQLDQSRRAADTWLIDLSGSLQFYPGLEPVREKLIGDAITHYQGLLESKALGGTTAFETSRDVTGGNPNYASQQTELKVHANLEKAKVQIRLGDLLRLQGKKIQAAELYRKAEETLISTALGPEIPRVRMDDLKIQQANCVTGLVLLNERGIEDCQSHFQWMQCRLTQLNIETTTVDTSKQTNTEYSFANDLVSCFARMNLAVCRVNVDGNPKSSYGRAATKGAKWLVNQRGSDADYRLLQTALAQWATSQLAEEGVTQAIQTWQQLVDQLEGLVSKFPQRIDHWQSLAHTRIQLANSLAKSDVALQRQEAIGQLQQAIKDLNQAWSLSDGQGFFMGNLAAAENNLGMLFSRKESLATTDSKQAAAHFVRSLDYRRNVIRQNPTVEDIRRYCQTIHSLSEVEGLDEAVARRYLNEADTSFQIIRDQGQLTSKDQKIWNRLLKKKKALQNLSSDNSPR